MEILAIIATAVNVLILIFVLMKLNDIELNTRSTARTLDFVNEEIIVDKLETLATDEEEKRNQRLAKRYQKSRQRLYL